MRIPSAPSFGKLHIASPADILRLSIVATAGFRYSEQFIWERPYHVDFPMDTIVFFRHEMTTFVKSREYIILTATDAYDPQESFKTEAVIPEDNGWEPPAAGEDVIVAIAVWKLEAGSKRIGHFQNCTGSYPALPDYLRRDLNAQRAQNISAVAEAAEVKYFEGYSELERVVVHPAYWKHGHGGALTRWGMALADIDGVTQGVIATSLGAGMFRHLGFQQITDKHVEGDEENPKGMDLSILKYTAGWKAEM